MTIKQAEKLQNKIKTYVHALLEEIDYPYKQNGNHEEFLKVCAKTTRKNYELRKFIQSLVKEEQ